MDESLRCFQLPDQLCGIQRAGDRYVRKFVDLRTVLPAHLAYSEFTGLVGHARAFPGDTEGLSEPGGGSGND